MNLKSPLKLQAVLALLSIILTGLSVGVNAADAAEGTPLSFPSGRACTPSEGWNFNAAFPKDFSKEFIAFLSTGKKSLRGFSEAVALRKLARNPEEKAFAEYWMAHALMDSGQHHIAYQGFIAIASKPVSLDYMGVQAAAVDCALQLHYMHPSFVVPQQLVVNLPSFMGQESLPEDMKAYFHTIVWDAETAEVQRMVGDDKVPPSAIQTSLNLLKGSGAYQNFAQGLWYAKKGEHFKTIESLNAFVTDPKMPPHLKRFLDPAYVLLARAHYTVGEYDVASDLLKKVNKHANELAETLSELSWAYLQNEKYAEAIGTSMNLEAGGLRHAFAPEAPMVMAMAMNELCQYPDAVRAIAIFKKNYEPSYKWLSNWVNAGGADSSKLYSTSIAFVERKAQGIPDRVGTEWIRSPLFISTQDEINLLFDERDSVAKISTAAATEQRKMATEILQKAREIKPKLKIAKMKLKPGETLPRTVTDALIDLKDRVVHWHRMQLAAPTWSVVSSRFLTTVRPQQAKLIARISADIKDRNLKMYTMLDEILENIQLIEVEIYNGASEDIIWQNAHPDYKEIAKSFKDDMGNSPDKVWDWGRSLAGADENTEIWEDELGSFKANLFDNCSSKDRYLAIRVRRK